MLLTISMLAITAVYAELKEDNAVSSPVSPTRSTSDSEKRISCSDLPLTPPHGGEMRVVSGSDGSTFLVYSCLPGYNLIGQSVRVCEGGTWVGEQARCESVYQACQRILPPAPEFGRRFIVADHDEYNSVYRATYKCRPGYKLIGQQSISCTDVTADATFVVPACRLDLFDSFGYCQFTSTSKSCLVVNEMTRPNKWIQAKTSCSYVDGIRRVVTEYHKIPSVLLRNATYGDSLLHKTQSDDNNTDTAYGLSELTTANRPCYEGQTSYSMVLKLQPPVFTKRSSMELKITDATLEVGSLDSVYAGYVKFKIEAPPGATAYALFVAGHCLPDPPGHLRVVAYIPPNKIGEVERDFCMDLARTVKCASGRFRFSVRIRFFMAHSPFVRGVIRLTNKGVYTSICPGSVRADNVPRD